MFKIKMAGLTIQINNRYPFIRQLCEDYITDEEAFDITASASDEEILAQIAADNDPTTPDYCESLCIYRNICLQLPVHDAFLIHSAGIAVDNEAYLFLAKSGVGKSTHVRLWAEAFYDRSHIINGDKPILRKIGKRWFVCGTPWQGKENWGSNTRVPLKAICFLERSEKNHIRSIEADQVAERIFHQLLMPKEEAQISAFFLLLEDLLKKIPAYLMQCNQEKEAALVAYEGMRQSPQ
ncbi:MAG: hypothetical protein Q4F24_15365 [Eubacteriales bacterium]|nr:hypothetical protein [Eubacteriales bacterium]